jgi:hypothetical protein
MEEINTLLLHLKNNSFRKRIRKECEFLYEEYPNVSLSFVNDDKKEALIKINDKGVSYTFMVNSFSYPFTAPIIYINNKIHYEELLKIHSEYERTMLKNIRGVNCFCCHSCICPGNWNPTTTLDKVINEIKYVHKFRRDLVNKIIADKIKARYLIVDIDLDSWLF